MTPMIGTSGVNLLTHNEMVRRATFADSIARLAAQPLTADQLRAVSPQMVRAIFQARGLGSGFVNCPVPGTNRTARTTLPKALMTARILAAQVRRYDEE